MIPSDAFSAQNATYPTILKQANVLVELAETLLT